MSRFATDRALYRTNVSAWWRGFRHFGSIRFRLGWRADWRWKLLYTLDIGANVLTGGRVETLSSMMQTHRNGWLWDKVLDTIETVDEHHGEKAARGGPLWGSEFECSTGFRVVVAALLLTGLWALL
jgi:hypothetical protein